MPSGTKADLNTNNPYGSKTHKGVDIVVPVGTNVVAPEDGKVVAMNRSDKNGKRVFGNAGLFLNFESADGKRLHKFFHLSVVTEFGGADKLQLPFPFNKGETLALSGGKKGAYGSGNSDGPHLHWEVYVDGVNVNPMSLFPPSTN
jgi:murein DD-endopeptidase MepM/ murein hydrolase activator NlpD